MRKPKRSIKQLKENASRILPIVRSRDGHKSGL